MLSNRRDIDGVTYADLVIGDEGNTVVDSHSADEEVILQVACIVIGQVDYQVNMTLVDQSTKICKKKTNKSKTMSEIT